MRVIDITHYAYKQIRFWAVAIDRCYEPIDLVCKARANDTADMVCLSALADRIGAQSVPSRYDDG